MPSWKAWASSLWQRQRKAKPKKRSEETVSRDTLDRLFVLPSERVHEIGPFGCIHLADFMRGLLTSSSFVRFCFVTLSGPFRPIVVNVATI